MNNLKETCEPSRIIIGNSAAAQRVQSMNSRRRHLSHRISSFFPHLTRSLLAIARRLRRCSVSVITC